MLGNFRILNVIKNKVVRGSMGWFMCLRSDACRSVRGFPTLLSTMMLGVARHPFRIDGVRVYDEGAVRLR